MGSEGQGDVDSCLNTHTPLREDTSGMPIRADAWTGPDQSEAKSGLVAPRRQVGAPSKSQSFLVRYQILHFLQVLILQNTTMVLDSMSGCECYY